MKKMKIQSLSIDADQNRCRLALSPDNTTGANNVTLNLHFPFDPDETASVGDERARALTHAKAVVNEVMQAWPEH